MKTLIQPLCIATAFLTISTSSLRAQVVADGATDTLSNVTTNFTGDVIVGTNGSFTLLVLSNNALLTNSVRGLIGRNATAKSNEVRLVSASARWRMGNNLFVGSNGAFSRLVVSNGALVENLDGILANGAASSNNVVLVTGGGSVWSNRGNLAVGFFGRQNQLVVSNGGRVLNRFGYVGQQLGSSDNLVRVTGSGSVWSNQFDLFVGGNERSNRLVVEAGGLVINANGYFGNSSSSGSSEALVTGPGSLWSNHLFLTVGDIAGRNRLVVSNGGMISSESSIVGNFGLGLSNHIIVTGAGSVWSNQSSLTIGVNSQGNRVDVSEGGRLVCDQASVGEGIGADNNTVLVTGTGSIWSNRATLILGNTGAGNAMIASNSGAFYNTDDVAIGVNNGANGNSFLLADTGTVFRNGSDLYLGSNGALNRLVITNGAKAFVQHLLYVGYNSGALSNAVTVTGPGSALTNLDYSVLGNNSARNLLLVTNGAAAYLGGGFVGIGVTSSFASNNVALVTGSNSFLGFNQGFGRLDIGRFGDNNQLIATNGGKISGPNFALIGFDSVSNSAVITGPGSAWTDIASLSVGQGDTGNRLIVSNGGLVSILTNLIQGEFNSALNSRVAVDDAALTVTNAAGTAVFDIRRGTSAFNGGLIDVDFLRLTNALGFFDFNGGTLITRGAFVDNGSAFVVGYGATNPAVWDVRAGASNVINGDLYVGYYGSFCQLLITNGALLRGLDGFVGFKIGANSNAMLFSGSNSKWAGGNLRVGYGGAFNRLTVSNGAVAEGITATIGYDTTSSNNLALVTGAGSLWTNRGEMYVGESGSGNQLVISSGGVAFAQFTRFLGHSSGATSNNTAIVTGASSRWLGPGNLEVGGPAAFSQLLVSDGARVENNSGFIGSGSSASNNLGVVTDAGSVWSNANSLFVGSGGAGNQLVVSNGATVFGYEGLIGYTSFSSNNLAMVTGAGSTWSNAVDLFVGNDGRGNQLVVSNGGIVRGPYGTIGLNASSSNNLALITGAGSSWSNAISLFVGNAGQASRLIVTNGGTVTAGERISLGGLISSSNNRVVVHGGMLLATNPTITGALDVRRGTNVLNAGLIETDLLLLTNTLGKFDFNGGTLVTRGASISNGVPFIVGISGTIPALWDVRASAINHVLAVPLFVGFNSSFNQLLITNGGFVRSTSGELGARSGSTNNQVFVTGTGSAWNNDSHIYVGTSGADNRLLVNNGGAVSNADAYIGGNTPASNNLALVTGAGSAWTSLGELHVGLNGVGNQLVVSNGGTVFTFANKYVGYNDGALSNTAIVTDPGSRWLGDDSLYVGSAGSFNRLLILNGGQVVSGIGTLGGILGANSNQVLVTDVGSMWTNQLDLNVGEGGSGNRLAISNGAAIFGASDGFIGRNAGANSNSAIVTDLGTRWLLSSNLYVGSNGALNSLVISNGALLQNGFGFIGSGRTSSNNIAIVTGSGSLWSNAVELFVGSAGAGNQLVVSSGATIIAGSGSIGNITNANRNSAILTDSGSRWLLTSNLFVGNNGSSNRLVLSNGALLQNGQGIIGGAFGSSNNEVVVADPGSVWSNAATLFVGFSGAGTGNRLVVSNGALVASFHGTFGGPVTNSDNQALVTGTGSRWVIESTLTVGSFGSGNRLVVSNGASLRSGFAVIGNSPSTNNEVVVTGAGSSWTNGSNLLVGGTSHGNRLTISDGAEVFEQPFNVIVGSSASSTNNRLIVDGGALRIPSLGSALDVRGGTNVFNAGLIDVTRLLLTNALGVFEFNGGTLVASGTAIGNGRVFTVGNGASAATFTLRSGTHSFANNLVIASNAFLLGNGTILGTPTIQPGGTLAPGVSIGKLVFSNSPVLQGATIMELSKNGATITNDQIQVAGTLTYGGSLIVSNLGPTTLAAGDRFQLFSANSYAGSFSSITLPPLTPGLSWTNKLRLDGSIEVVLPPPPTLNIQFSNNFLTVSWPTNAPYFCLETAFDLAPPVIWQPITNTITTSGASFLFTLASTPVLAKQFFRLAYPCAPTPVVLALQRTNNLMTVSWPSNAFRLETTFSLAPPASWQTVSNGISDSGALRTFTFTNNPAITNQFFRLALP